MSARVPVARDYDRQPAGPKTFDRAIGRTNDLVAAGDAEGTAGQKIELYVGNDEGVPASRGRIRMRGRHHELLLSDRMTRRQSIRKCSRLAERASHVIDESLDSLASGALTRAVDEVFVLYTVAY